MSCPQDCTGPLYPGPCRGVETALEVGYSDFAYLFEYELVGENTAVTKYDDLESDGSDESTFRFVLDADGNVISRGYDSNADGEIEWLQLMYYDSEGRLTGEDLYARDQVTLLSQTSHEYDAAGYRSRTVTVHFSSTGQDEEILYEWNADHTFCMENIDRGATGNVNSVNLMTYDATGNLIHLDNGRYDNQCDFYYDHAKPWPVSPGTIILLPYGSVGRPARLVEYRCVWQGEPGPGERFTYDAHGNLTQSENHRGGATEPANRITYVRS